MTTFGLIIAGVVYALPFQVFDTPEACRTAANNLHLLWTYSPDPYEITCTKDSSVVFRIVNDIRR